MSVSSTSVMLADDHAVVRMGFRLLLQATDDIKVIAEVESGEAVVQQYAVHKPDVLVLDLSMPGIGGLEALRRLLAKYPDAKILVLTAHDDLLHPRRVLQAGALGYLSKRSAPEELIRAVRQVAAGKIFIEAGLAQQLAMQNVQGESSPVELLSPREFEVFLQLARGKSVNEIAEQLFLSPRTVGTHLYNLKQKLNVSNTTEIVLIAIRTGLVEADR
ncbi:MAG: response regulator transcription factor [Burkholderiales bacterium]